MIFTTKPNRREMLLGGIYLFLYITILPWLLPLGIAFLFPGLNIAQMNFVYFCVNFTATTVIFRKYLLKSLRDALRIPGNTLWYAVLGYMGSQLLSSFLMVLILRIYPEFTSINDDAISVILRDNRPLMVIGAVVLAPVAEELLFRGLIFRGLYDRSPALAYGASMVLFSAIHVTNYIGQFDPLLLLLCFVQYLPASYCLNFAYRYSGSIVSPILMHMLTNLVALSAMR